MTAGAMCHCDGTPHAVGVDGCDLADGGAERVVERVRRVGAARSAMLAAVACHPRDHPVSEVLGDAIDRLDRLDRLDLIGAGQ